MRLDRFIALNLVQPARRAFSLARLIAPPSSAKGFSIPVLMYHRICDEPQPDLGPYYKTNTSPAVFRRQMQFLADNGCYTVNLEQALELLKPTSSTDLVPNEVNGPPLSGPRLTPPRPLPGQGRMGNQAWKRRSNEGPQKPAATPVVLTFDDGFRNFYTEAFPILETHGFTAIVFLPTGLIRDESISPTPPVAYRTARSDKKAFNAFEYMTWNEVQELHTKGIHFGCHTVNHPALRELAWNDIRYEVCESQRELQERLGEPIRTFAFPGAFPQRDGQFVATFTNLLRDNGFTCCATTEVGRVRSGDDAFRLKRLPINGCDDLTLFRAKLDGGYDWMAWAQRSVKSLRALKPAGHQPVLQPG